MQVDVENAVGVAVGDGVRQVYGQRGFADPAGTADGDDRRHAGFRGGERLVEPGELDVASGEGAGVGGQLGRGDGVAECGLLCRSGQLEDGIASEHRLLEPAQLGTRLDPELLDHDAASLLVERERFRRPSSAIQRQHQLRVRPLPQRVRLDVDGQIRYHRMVITRRHPQIDVILQSGETFLRQTGGLDLGPLRRTCPPAPLPATRPEPAGTTRPPQRSRPWPGRHALRAHSLMNR
ncbi:hypothetical protein GCM10020220_053870 [Nonomuraea rubra]